MKISEKNVLIWIPGNPKTNTIPEINQDYKAQRVALLNWTPKTQIIIEKQGGLAYVNQ